ncbi:MAG: GTPase [Solirubrobacteraceae bacterium]
MTRQETSPQTLEQVVERAVSDGLEALDKLAVKVEGGYAEALEAAMSAVEEHGDAVGGEPLADFVAAIERGRDEVRERFGRQRKRLETFNLVLFGRTGAGKSSLIEALSCGDGSPISQGESDWTTDVREVRWGACRLFDTPGIAGWGRTMARSELESRAKAAVADADIVLLCFDSQSQQDGEFAKVAEWIAQYGKPVIAILNSRNGRWRFPTRVARAAARRQLSRSVHEHASNIRDELARIALPDVPVIALHSKRAAFGRTSDPYDGPDAKSREKLREEVGTDLLTEWSNLPALELLLTRALEAHAQDLRLGMLHEQARGILRSSLNEFRESEKLAQTTAKQLERGVEDVLRVLGRPTTDDLDKRLKQLEKLRTGRFDAPRRGEIEQFTRARLAEALRAPRADALRRAERLIERAFTERFDIDDARFRRDVLGPAGSAAEDRLALVEGEVAAYLEKRLRLVADDVRADLAAVLVEFAGAQGTAGSRHRTVGLGTEGGGAAVGIVGGIYLAVTGANIWNPVGWALAVGGIAGGQVGRLLRRKGMKRREEALGKARANARRAVNETFDEIERTVADSFAAGFAELVAARLGDEVDHALAWQRLSRAAQGAATVLDKRLRGVRAASDVAGVMPNVARAAQRCEHPGDPRGDRLLWLGEAWCEDPLGLDPEDGTRAEPARTSAYDPRRRERLTERLKTFARRYRSRPAPGTGLAWLSETCEVLASDAEATGALAAARDIADRGRPLIAVVGDYSTGKSSFVKRLLVDAGSAAPEDLVVAAHAETAQATTVPWGEWDLVDTPGFQSSNVEHARSALQAVAGAAITVVLFNPNLVVGDTGDLSVVLFGHRDTWRVGKLGRTLFVVNRSDELGVDPHDDLDGYERLCGRKELELSKAIESVGAAAREPAPLDADQILCVASDPYGMVGNRREITSAEYDGHRDWDGMDAFHRAFRDTARDAVRNGVDVGVLEAGCAALGDLADHRRAALKVHQEGTVVLRRLLLDVTNCVAGGDAILTAYRDRLASAFRDEVAVLYDACAEAQDDVTRAARIERLEHWFETPEVEQAYREETKKVEVSLADWWELTEEKIDSRLESLSFRSAFGAVDQPVDASHLRPEGDSDAVSIGKHVGEVGVKAASGANREILTKMVHSFGGKFKPWGATKLTSKVRVAGGGLGLALGGLELYSIWKRDKKAGADAEEEHRARTRILAAVRTEAERFFDGDDDDSPTALVRSRLSPVTEYRDARAADLDQRERDEVALAHRIEACDIQLKAASEAL